MINLPIPVWRERNDSQASILIRRYLLFKQMDRAPRSLVRSGMADSRERDLDPAHRAVPSQR